MCFIKREAVGNQPGLGCKLCGQGFPRTEPYLWISPNPPSAKPHRSLPGRCRRRCTIRQLSSNSLTAWAHVFAYRNEPMMSTSLSAAFDNGRVTLVEPIPTNASFPPRTEAFRLTISCVTPYHEAKGRLTKIPI